MSFERLITLFGGGPLAVVSAGLFLAVVAIYWHLLRAKDRHMDDLRLELERTRDLAIKVAEAILLLERRRPRPPRRRQPPAAGGMP